MSSSLDYRPSVCFPLFFTASITCPIFSILPRVAEMAQLGYQDRLQGPEDLGIELEGLQLFLWVTWNMAKLRQLQVTVLGRNFSAA